MWQEFIATYFHFLIMCFAAVWGAVVGRVFAIEGQNRPSAILAAGYCGAGAGLMSGPPFAVLLSMVALSPATSEPSGFLDAVEDIGAGLLWGAAGGAAGGLAIGLLVVALGGGRRAIS